VDTIEGPGVFAEQCEEVIEYRLDRLCGVAFTFTHDKTRGSAVTMGASYILLGNGAVDHVNIGVEDRIMVQMPYEATMLSREPVPGRQLRLNPIDRGSVARGALPGIAERVKRLIVAFYGSRASRPTNTLTGSSPSSVCAAEDARCAVWQDAGA
jgi:hypothetical protein